MYGRLYYDSSLGNGATSGPYTCVDLATGKTLWTNNDISPTFGMLYLYESFNQHGVIGDGYLVQTSGSTWRIFDARTGLALFNITGAPSVGGGFFGGYGAASMGPSGEIVSYSFDNTNHWLAQWNSSAGPNTPLVATPGNATESFQYRPSGSEDMSKAFDWNVTLATLPAGSSILRTIPGDMILFYTSPAIGFFGWGTNPFSVTAVSLKPYSRGYVLWQKFYQPPAGNLSRSMGPVDPVTRVFTMVDKETMQWSGFDLDSGEQIWGPIGNFRAFQYYGQVSNPPAPGHIAYGNLYIAGYGGELHCFDAKTGTLKWIYNNTYSGDQTPWGLYPLFITSIADGKVYMYTSEHSPNVPLYKGSQVRAVDALTGQELWKLDSWYAIGSFGQSPAPVADGKIAYLNVYDMQLYCLGKGPSATTVEAPLAGVTQGQSIIIQGKVTDQSPGAKQLIEDNKFSTIPVASDASQGGWMAHLYMQKPIPDNFTGVDVAIDAMDASGAVTRLATVKSDASGLYSYAWTPQKSGQFTILATFEGSNSYYASYDETAVSVNAAPAASPTSPPTQGPTVTPPPTQTPTPSPSPSQPPAPTENPNTALYVGIAAVVIIAIIAAVATILRRRK